jgi:hypothetical protein
MLMGEVTVTSVDAVEPLPSVAVAVTWHDSGARGAVNNPPWGSMEPQEAVNVAATLAVNCWVAFSLTVGVSGDSENCPGAPIVSWAVALFAGPLVALPVMVQTEPAAADAVNSPVDVMLPQLADHATG